MNLSQRFNRLFEAFKGPDVRGRAQAGRSSSALYARARSLLSKKKDGKDKPPQKREKKQSPFKLKAKDQPRKQVAEPKKEKPAADRSGGSSRLSARSHYPFKRRSELGPTKIHRVKPPAPPPRRTRVHRRRNQWSCKKIEAYKQMCTGVGDKNRGKKLKITINRAYKHRYNKAFKRHRTLKRAEARRQGKKSIY